MRELMIVSQDVILETLYKTAVSGFHYKTKPVYSKDGREDFCVLEIEVLTKENIPFLTLEFKRTEELIGSSRFSELPEVQRALNLTSSHPLPIVRDLIKSLIETLTTFNQSVTIVTSTNKVKEGVVRYPKFLISNTDLNSTGVIEIKIPELPTLQ